MIRARVVVPAALLLGLLSATVVAATPADSVKARTDGYKALGAAFKKFNDTVRGDGNAAVLKIAASDMVNVSKWQFRWFPKGTAAGTPGLKTAAKPEIWSNAAGFKTAQDNFAAQAAVLQKAVAAGDLDVIRSEGRKLGATCKNCHDNFRVPSD